ncbi:Uncharacterised protein [Mycobacteroides abscessus subsp. abscessus]|uniref:hypothetical protein n=1 Tax=Mycobacteroides abscessus TaxID=36809 RepID=UPI0009A6FE38|nr:hypothetical protein [Mycobacteroides abscessus]SLJ22823.1 Uncharacterised protein [Mycobacteroides abscessus subsp. abscessus]
MNTPTDDEPTTEALVAAVQDLALAAGLAPAAVAVYGGLMNTIAATEGDPVPPPGPVELAAQVELQFHSAAEMSAWIYAEWDRIANAGWVLDSLREIGSDHHPAPIPGAAAYRNAGEQLTLDAGESCAAVAWAGVVAEARWIRLMTGREVSWDELTAANAPARAVPRWLPEPERDRVRDFVFESWEQVDDMATAAA